MSLRIAALIPAYNEAGSIGSTLTAVLGQHRVPDLVVCIPNGCSDATAEVARGFEGVTVLELPRLEHKKSEALNRAWNTYARDYDVIICLDADTVLPPNAVGDWEQEFLAEAATDRSRTTRRVKVRDLPLGGSSSKFTMLGGDFLTRLQRAEFARWTDTSLKRGWTSVLAGTGCAISGRALREVVALTGREGPWSYDSQVEDFELTHEIRKLGYRCQVSPTVRAYTDSMTTVKALWGQRMKWQTGTVEDLMRIGVSRLTLLDWWQQAAGLFAAAVRLLWLVIMVGLVSTGTLHFIWFWWVIVPVVFVASEFKAALRIPHRDRRDLLMALAIVPSEVFAWLRAGWFIAAWAAVARTLVTGRRKDRWALQYAAEGV
ncbi:cellulose synthase/poly-beta-1,6-N-acetylglucosamine synthase-like glycosyltransferase [Friedmanniella endophytica]|uniref:Cellulose synthase/poly-beta-1,6-N-acetylglucosamine synthase-like glycosyltransferase n=1 Tax=Microlunatus kandeliicorticis TaxID=1759536 RepID=A0A7W3IPP4_9ACTN|nr:glycosyltransferase family 2 protein [Microlunatus kandeliicorticis]MBA8792962.1 cellulose synthase/poly-beta-1,6-N-acetylglucosamine synthase-like glycosyltransferase [Microlunatus kandeliicorticis]